MRNEGRLVLGTAQLGMFYGIANKIGQPDLQTAEQIVETAWDNGICEFDTAQAYGASEQVLGRSFRAVGISNEVRVITKFHPDVDSFDCTALEQSLELSLANLKVGKLFGVLFHDEAILDVWGKGPYETLRNFVKSGLVEHIGVSVYSPARALQALQTDGILMIQLPSNILDRRFERAGVFRIAEEKGKQIYVRSVFLQGLMLMNPDDLPKHMHRAVPVLQSLNKLARDWNYSLPELSLGYIKQALPQTKVLFGAETVEQLKENVKHWKTEIPHKMVRKVQDQFNSVDERILDPSLWD
ncbi:MAG: aldo/keto reductase [Desulfobacterales bacterium]|nr:aldo/keto reductase [Desulfobacterales bacterium]